MEKSTPIGTENYRYLRIGNPSGKKLLILWGVGSYKESVLSLIDREWSGYDILIPEYPYHNGFNDITLEISDIKCITDYLHPLLLKEGFNDFYALGFSFGGIVLLEMLKNYTDIRVDKAVFWSSPILGNAGIAELSKSVSDVYMRARERHLVSVQSNPALKKALQVRGVRLFDPPKVKKYLQVIKAYKPCQFDFKTKCLFIYDPADIIVSEKNAKYLKELESPENITVTEVRGGGHLGTNKGKKEVLNLIREFYQI